MDEVLDRPSVAVYGVAIAAEAIAAEMQNHPAPDADAAWQAAARALVTRQLLLDEADRLGIQAAEVLDTEGRPLTTDDARIEALLQSEVAIPTADEDAARRFYDTHQARFTSPTVVEAEHILFAANPDDSLAYGLATGDARGIIRTLQREPDQFAALAKRHSACPSKEQGGNLGQIGPGQTVPEFEAVLFALDEGALLPEPLKSRYGVHVIRAGRRAVGRVLPFDMVRATIMDYLNEAVFRKAASQYCALLAGQAKISGVALPVSDGMMVQ